MAMASNSKIDVLPWTWNVYIVVLALASVGRVQSSPVELIPSGFTAHVPMEALQFPLCSSIVQEANYHRVLSKCYSDTAFFSATPDRICSGVIEVGASPIAECFQWTVHFAQKIDAYCIKPMEAKTSKASSLSREALNYRPWGHLELAQNACWVAPHEHGTAGPTLLDYALSMVAFASMEWDFWQQNPSNRPALSEQEEVLCTKSMERYWSKVSHIGTEPTLLLFTVGDPQGFLREVRKLCGFHVPSG
jgi:hypothetical protein